MNGDGLGLGTSSAASRLGVVIGGSLKAGLDVRLDDGRSVEQMAVGRYVVVHGQHQRFFGMVTDVLLQTEHAGIVGLPTDSGDDFVREVLAGTAAYGMLRIMPLLALDPAIGEPRPVKTVPAHYATVCEAEQDDIARIFGDEGMNHFRIGSPLDMDVKVCLNYNRFIERSNGVFGKTGTGKTFLTRILLASTIMTSDKRTHESDRAVHLIFDMHNEYGWAGKTEGRSEVKGLKQLYPGRVAVFSLDPESSARRNAAVDGPIEIGYGDIEPQDMAALGETLNLTDAAVDATYVLQRRFGQKHWVREALTLRSVEDETKDTLAELNVHAGSFANLRRGLDRLVRHAFVREETQAQSVRRVLEHLLGGTSVVLEFGRYGDDLAAYMLVANILTRRIHEEYRKRTEIAAGDESRRPNHLVITIEEAHKFLSRKVASQTIFGEIAREMRKYNVTLLIVDQRPSGIDDEVMSQIGTKFSCLLDDESDIDAVLSGVSGRSELRSVLARLDSRQQALIFGHAVPMPVVVQTESYGPETYERLTGSQLDGRGLLERLREGAEDW
ncbi:MAG TPA: ATP-binding protein [Dehalococcoidia bacterium]|nr:ATP-binding protein [Dehalococcoidia bacterium]